MPHALQICRTICYCALWVAQHGEALEATVREKHAGEPAWEFLSNRSESDAVIFYRRRIQFEKQRFMLQWAGANLFFFFFCVN
jgi:hypothetical protein